MLPVSVLNQSKNVKTYGPKYIKYAGQNCQITAEVRWDDTCKNGHNSFAITADIRTSHRNREVSCGCLHEEVAHAFPELAPFIKWHLVSSDGPMHYVSNVLFHLGRTGMHKTNPIVNLAYARTCAVWPKMPEGYVITGTLLSNAWIERALMRRLPALMNNFKKDIEKLGFVY